MKLKNVAIATWFSLKYLIKLEINYCGAIKNLIFETSIKYWDWYETSLFKL